MKQSETIKHIPSNRLQFFPIMMFAVVMGFSGLSLVFSKMEEILSFPSFISFVFTIVSTLLFFIILFLLWKEVF